jgi:(E)-4-hydroxy-3-methylbut-2-enyl-diphosphate synthase
VWSRLGIIQALGLRNFVPSVTATCEVYRKTNFPRFRSKTDPTIFLRSQMPIWRKQYQIEAMKVAVWVA